MIPKSVSVSTLADIQGLPITANLVSVHEALVVHGPKAGLDHWHRLVPYLAQIGHETFNYRYDREIWGPTAAQRRYDTRTDLGNTPERDGDGFKNRGHGSIQVTGGYNIREFRDWCRKNVDRNCPDFVADPGLICTDPWEGLSAIWYWTTRNLNRIADVGDNHAITRKINGGYNGLDDRLARYSSIGLTVLGYGSGSEETKRFQRDAGISVDGKIGKNTRLVIHQSLRAAGSLHFLAKASKTSPSLKPTGQRHWLVSFILSLFNKA